MTFLMGFFLIPRGARGPGLYLRWGTQAPPSPSLLPNSHTSPSGDTQSSVRPPAEWDGGKQRLRLLCKGAGAKADARREHLIATPFPVLSSLGHRALLEAAAPLRGQHQSSCSCLVSSGSEVASRNP